MYGLSHVKLSGIPTVQPTILFWMPIKSARRHQRSDGSEVSNDHFSYLFQASTHLSTVNMAHASLGETLEPNAWSMHFRHATSYHVIRSLSVFISQLHQKLETIRLRHAEKKSLHHITATVVAPTETRSSDRYHDMRRTSAVF